MESADKTEVVQEQPDTLIEPATEIPETVADKTTDEVKPQGVVMYTDGGCIPQTGLMGWGFHGYRYEIGKPKKGSGHPSHTLTKAGYYPKGDKKEEVTVLDYYDAFGARQDRGTNNMAELLAAKNVFSKVFEFPDVKDLIIRTDSEYLRKGVTEWSQHWIKNNWIRRDGSPVPNRELWKDVLADVKVLNDRDVNLSIEWVRGHSDNFGNVLADKLATVGVRNSVSGNSVTEIKKSAPEGYWKTEVEKHPFFFNRTFYFNTLKSSHYEGEYFLGNHNKEDELLGCKDSDGAYSVAQMRQPEAIMEMIRQYPTELSGDFDTIVLVRMMKLYNSRTYQELLDHGRFGLIRAGLDRIDLNALDREPLTRELKPALLAWRAIESISALKEILVKYRLGQTDGLDLVATDVTDVFYDTEEVTKKGVTTQTQKLKTRFIVGFSKLEVKAKALTKHGAIEIPVTLVLGQDIADRNALKRLETLGAKVNILTWSQAPDVYRYVTVIESDGNYLISAGMYSNTYYHEPLQAA